MKKLPGWIFLFFIYQANSQTINLGQNGALVDSVMKSFVAEQRDLLPVYNGRLFYTYASSIEGHAFYTTKDWYTGSVLYDGVWYRDLTMMYDLLKDAIIVKHPNGVPITLYSERIQQFNIAGSYFVRLGVDKDKVIRPGFYQVMAAGDVTLYARRSKLIEERIVGNEIERKFIDNNHFYAYTNDSYTWLKKPKTLLSLLNEKKQKVTQYMSAQKVSYKREPERAMLMIAEYNNQLH